MNNFLVCDLATGKFEWSDTGTGVNEFAWINDDELFVRTQMGRVKRGLQMERKGGYPTIRRVGDVDRPTEVVDIHWKGKYGAVEGTDQIIRALPPTPLHGWPDGATYQYFARPEDGKLDSCIMSDRGVLSFYRYDGEKFIKSPIDPWEITPIALGPKPGQVVVLGPRQEGRPRAIQYMDVASGKLGDVIYQDGEVRRRVRRPPQARDLGYHWTLGLSTAPSTPCGWIRSGSACRR